MRVQIDGLAKAYGSDAARQPVLEGIDLAVERGAFVCALGPSGCGKTTLLNLLVGLTMPDAGAIRLDGRDVPHVRAQAAYMQQKDLLLPWRTALGNATLGAEIERRPLGQAREEARVLFGRFGLGGHEDHLPAALSGGQRQRVALVRALLTERPLWLLDEPFGALDPLTRARLHDWMLEAWGAFGKTVLMVTHDLEEAVKLADRVYVLTPRPAGVRAAVDVPLARPRDPLSASFVSAKRTLWAHVSEGLGEA